MAWLVRSLRPLTPSDVPRFSRATPANGIAESGNEEPTGVGRAVATRGVTVGEPQFAPAFPRVQSGGSVLPSTTWRTLPTARTCPAVGATMHLYPMNGAASRVGSDETAFAFWGATVAPVIVA